MRAVSDDDVPPGEPDTARLDRLLGVARPDVEDEPFGAALLPPAKPDRVDAAYRQRELDDEHAMPPWDAGARLALLARDVTYLVDSARTWHNLAKMYYDRYMTQRKLVRQLVMAADRGSSLTKHLDALRDTLPANVYKRPPR